MCCVHDRAAAYRRRLVDHFADGLRDGLRVAYVCPGGPAAAQADLADLGDLGRLLGDGVPDRLRAGADAGVPVIDMADVEYVDHRLLRTPSDHARATGVALSLRSAPPFAARLVDLLPASFLRLSEVGAES